MTLHRSLVAAGLIAAAGTLAPVPALAPAAHAQGQQVQPLRIGDTPPALEHVDWLRGNEASTYEKGTVYVLDFWATWCGPCIRSMPHLQELQQKYADKNVEFIGVAIWPRNGTPAVADWIRNPRGFNGEVTWTIAEDNAAGDTAREYMEAMGQNGIPTVAIIDRDTRLAWVGHPMSMDTPLAQIVEGKYSIEARAKAESLLEDAREAARAEEWDRVVEIFDEVIELDSDWMVLLGLNKYIILRDKVGDLDAAETHGEAFLASPAGEDPDALNSLAWQIVDPDLILRDEQRHADLAIKAAERAVRLTERKDASILDTLAHAYALKGQYDKAISTEEEAIELERNPAQREFYEQVRDSFADAKKRAKNKP